LALACCLFVWDCSGLREQPELWTLPATSIKSVRTGITLFIFSSLEFEFRRTFAQCICELKHALITPYEQKINDERYWVQPAIGIQSLKLMPAIRIRTQRRHRMPI
jgi:hypothetical protein